MRLSDTDLWLLRLGTAVVGLAHLLVPERLLAAAAWGYRRVLAVEFRPHDGTTRRVRALGLLFLAAAVLAGRRGRR